MRRCLAPIRQGEGVSRTISGDSKGQRVLWRVFLCYLSSREERWHPRRALPFVERESGSGAVTGSNLPPYNPLVSEADIPPFRGNLWGALLASPVRGGGKIFDFVGGVLAPHSIPLRGTPLSAKLTFPRRRKVRELHFRLWGEKLRSLPFSSFPHRTRRTGWASAGTPIGGNFSAAYKQGALLASPVRGGGAKRQRGFREMSAAPTEGCLHCPPFPLSRFLRSHAGGYLQIGQKYATLIVRSFHAKPAQEGFP